MISRTPRRRIGSLSALVLLGSLLVSCTSSSGPPPERTAAQHFLDAVAAGDAARAAALTSSPATAAAALKASLAGLGTGAKGTLHVSAVHSKGSRATVDFTAAWSLAGATSPWRYTGHLALVRSGKSWPVSWTPADLYPGLVTGTHLQVTHVAPARAAVNTRDGRPIFTTTPVVAVGIEPKLVKNLPALARTLAAIPRLQSTAAEIIAAVKAAANPTDFVPVITLRRSAYLPIRAEIHDLDGTVFRDETQLLPPSAHWGQPLLGTVGPATAELVQKSKGRLAAGDDTGLGGVQQALDAQLAGTAAVAVTAVNDVGTTLRTLATVQPAKPGTPVTLTLDRATQQAAENTLAGLKLAATIVAVQRSTGRILADANSAAATYDLGLAAALPAGSTFKIATWAAAFTADPKLTPSSTVDCPATTTVDGRRFENENRFSYPPIPISSAFGYSCNTSAINEVMTLPVGALRASAAALGLGAPWTLPVTSFSGSLPLPATPTERAADAIGQGRVLVSPLLMALIAGAASSGQVVLPSLEAGVAPKAGSRLPASLVARMNALMKATVALPGGTGHELAGLGGVEGKTGTAEYGTATPPRSHAWFAGVRGDVAFAVFVYDGASAKISPVKLSRTFLSALR